MAAAAATSTSTAAPQGKLRRPALPGNVDIAESSTEFIFRVDVPGMTKKDVQVRVIEGHLQLGGERKEDEDTSEYRVDYAERSAGRFVRNFQLPENVDRTRIAATCDHGVLTVRVPKIAQETKRSTEVHIMSAEEEGDGSLNATFAEIPLSVFPTPALGSVIVLDSTMPLLEAVKVMSRNQILSAPVRNVKQADDAAWYDKYLGMLDMAGVVLSMLDQLKPDSSQDFATQMQSMEQFRTMTVGDAASFTRFAPFTPVDQDRGNLLDCMLLCGQYGIHRVVVVKTPGGDLTNIITQSALVQTLQCNLKQLSSVASKTLRELGLGTPDRVWKINISQPLREAFALIKEKGVSAVPVVDDNGAIRGNISARDVRLVVTSPKVYKLLNMPISMYLDVSHDGVVNSAICATPQDTMGTVIERLVASRIHRIYLVDAANRPIRVISLRNVIRKFVKEPEGYFGHYFMY